MAQASDALDRDQIARPRTRISERVVHGDAGAKERCGLLGGQVVRDRGHGFGTHAIPLARSVRAV
jgi:hypothetical protein